MLFSAKIHYVLDDYVVYSGEVPLYVSLKRGPNNIRVMMVENTF
jgi:hypothetical protein